MSKKIKGKWVKATGMMPPEYFGRHVCSVCGLFALRHLARNEEVLSDFCPNCGTDMRQFDVTRKINE